MSAEKQAVAFLKKSSAKDFFEFYTGICNVPRPQDKSFLRLFFKKEVLACLALGGGRRAVPRTALLRPMAGLCEA